MRFEKPIPVPRLQKAPYQKLKWDAADLDGEDYPEYESSGSRGAFDEKVLFLGAKDKPTARGLLGAIDGVVQRLGKVKSNSTQTRLSTR